MTSNPKLIVNSPIEVYKWFERHGYFSKDVCENHYRSFGFKTVARFLKDVDESGIPNSELTFKIWLKAHDYEII